MTTYYVTKVRKHQANGHNHIIGVVANQNQFYESATVVNSLNRGDTWYTEVAGAPNARIRPLQYCPAASVITRRISPPMPIALRRTTWRTFRLAERAC